MRSAALPFVMCISLMQACQGCERRSFECGEDSACFATALQSCSQGIRFAQRGTQTRWTIAGYSGPDCHVVAVKPGMETHCIYPTAIADAWREGALPDPWHGEQAEEACYAGDGGCGRLPHLAPLCVLGDCVAGRWTYTCEATPGGRVVQCEGTRSIDRAIDTKPPDAGCWLRCQNGKPEVECWPIRPGATPPFR